jgi:hypothetical protein
MGRIGPRNDGPVGDLRAECALLYSRPFGGFDSKPRHSRNGAMGLPRLVRRRLPPWAAVKEQQQAACAADTVRATSWLHPRVGSPAKGLVATLALFCGSC